MIEDGVRFCRGLFSITHPTAKTDIDQLVKQGYMTEIPLNKVKSGYIKGDKFDRMMETLK